MKKVLIALAALLVCGVALATQDTTLSQSDVRNPRILEAWLEANATDAETRLGILTTSTVGVSLWQTISNAMQTTISGDATVSAAGVLTLADNAAPAAQVGAGVLPGDVYMQATNVDRGNMLWQRVSNALQQTISGDITVTAAGAVVIAADAIEKGSLIAGDFGDFTAAADGTCTVDDNSLGMTDIAAADYGDITVGADGTVAVDNDAVLASEVGAGLLGGDILMNATNVDRGNLFYGRMSNALEQTVGGDATISAAGVLTLADNAAPADQVGPGLLSGDVLMNATNVDRGNLNYARVSNAVQQTISGDATVNAAGVLTIGASAVGSSEITDASVAAGDLASNGDGAVVAAHASCAETAVVMEKRVITLTNCVIITVDGADCGEGTNIWNGANGAFTVLGAVANLNVTSCAGGTTSLKLSVGTALPGEDNDLTSTEADVIPAITVTPDTGGVAADGVLASPVVLNGTAAAKALYMNVAMDNDNMAWNVTNTITGTITLFCTPTVDN